MARKFRLPMPLLALLALASMLAAPAKAELTEQDRADLARVETYLNSIQTLKARFLQVAPDGGLSHGDLYLRRPGRMRFEYDPPVPILVVADGIWVVFVDKEINQVQRLPLGSTPLSALVEGEIELQDSVAVDAVERSPGLLRVTLHDPDNPEEGALILVFTDEPLGLRQWQVRDAQGQETTIAVSEMQFNLNLDPALFVFFEPKDQEYQ